MGFDSHYKHERPGDAWLAVVDPKYITTPVTSHPERKYIDDPEINSMMNKLKEEKKTVYMVIHTKDGLLENPVEYFEELFSLVQVQIKRKNFRFGPKQNTKITVSHPPPTTTTHHHKLFDQFQATQECEIRHGSSF